MNLDTIREHFSIILDERQSAKVDYPLFDILFALLRFEFHGVSAKPHMHVANNGIRSTGPRLLVYRRRRMSRLGKNWRVQKRASGIARRAQLNAAAA